MKKWRLQKIKDNIDDQGLIDQEGLSKDKVEAVPRDQVVIVSHRLPQTIWTTQLTAALMTIHQMMKTLVITNRNNKIQMSTIKNLMQTKKKKNLKKTLETTNSRYNMTILQRTRVEVQLLKQTSKWLMIRRYLRVKIAIAID